MRNTIDDTSILSDDSFYMVPVGTNTIQPASFPGLGSQTYRRNGVSYTNIATKAAVVNQLESSLIQSEGKLVTALNGLPHLAVVAHREDFDFEQKFTTLELPHRLGAGVFALSLANDSWNLPEQLMLKMKSVGPYNAVAYFDPISALFGCFLAHYSNIPSIWSRFNGAVIGGVVATNTQNVISTSTTIDPLGSNKEEIGLQLKDKKASTKGMGNLIHIGQDVDAETIVMHLYFNSTRLRFYEQPVQDLLKSIYRYASLKTFSNGFDFRNRCFLKPVDPVEFDEDKLSKDIQKNIRRCKKLGLISETVLERTLPLSYLK